MRTIITFLFIGIITFLSSAQHFDGNNIDQARLEQLILQKLNEHRKSLNLTPLQPERYLQKAAAFHSKYQMDNNILTHDQPSKKYASPFKRVLALGGTNSLVGENVAFISSQKTYKEMAEEFYQGWKNSPPHYKNMIHPDYRYSGIRFQTDVKNNVVYGTHVFGGEMYIPPPVSNFPIGAYGISGYEEAICRPRKYYGKSASGMAHSIFTKGDSIFLYYEDQERMEKTIITDNDALAVDIIERRQFPCGQLNFFHGSEVHDGMMLPPVYKKELLGKNHRPYFRGYKIFMGLLPDGIQEHIDFSMITIQDSCRCDYGYAIHVPWGDLSLFHISPIWAFAELKEENYIDTIKPLDENVSYTNIKTTTTIQEERQVINVSFEKNKFQLKELPASLTKILKEHKTQIKSIKVEAFSSVEGPSDRNLFLQNKRAAVIAQAIRKYGIPSSKLTTTGKENWELFFAQITDTEWQAWKDLSKNKIKKLLAQPGQQNKIEALLKEERVAKVSIVFDREVTTETYSTTYFDEVKTSDDLQFLIKRFARLVAKSKIDSALLVQYELIHNFLERKISIRDITDVEIPLTKENLPLLSNQLAVELFFQKSIRTDEAYVEKMKQLSQLGVDYLPMKFNFMGFAARHLYATRDTIVDPVDLEFDIQSLSDEEQYLMTYLDAEETINRLLVNFHLGAIEYYEEQKQYSMRGESLEFIRDYFIDQGMTELETIQLALYFNQHGRSNWALDLLYPYLERGNYLENTLFIYVQTMAHKIDLAEENRQRFIKYGKIAAQRNPNRFCIWFNQEFQMLRWNEVKQLYCQTCE